MAEAKNILISGAGNAGPSLAFFLTKAGHKCTIVERASNFRSSGQQVDVSGEGLTVVKRMSIFDAIIERRIENDGLKFVTADNEVLAAFPAGGAGSLVKELEVLRPDIANIIYDETKEKVEYMVGDNITSVKQHDNGVRVHFAQSTDVKDFDLVVAADGLRSKTRELAFDARNTEIVSLNQYGGFFSIPWQESDGTWSSWYNASNRRCICLRPNKTKGITSDYLCQVTPDSTRVASMSTEEQREEILHLYRDAGWEAERVLEKLESENSDFYMAEAAQAKSASWSTGRVALLGDAGYCPSPVSGQGTTLALIGSYILAGCIATYPDHREALVQYEKQMGRFVEAWQKLTPGTPWIVNPQTSFGIGVLNNALRVASLAMNSRIASALGKVSAPFQGLFEKELRLPDFPALEHAA